MEMLVTGAAGFIGSSLVDALLAAGHDVRGVDCFTDYYDVAQKRANLVEAGRHPRFRLLEADLAVDDLAEVVDGADVVLHLAGQPGVRLSWSASFDLYVQRNIVATQRLLEAMTSAPVPARLVYASSSSIYGNAPSYPTDESTLPSPHSPYGVTKLAGEHLCSLYAANRGLRAVALRYFTVYGPRQRPDMAMHRLIESAISGSPFPLFGDGDQIRDFTYVGDVVDASMAAASADVAPGSVFNVSGGTSATMHDVLHVVEQVTGRQVWTDIHAPQAGDVHRTGGATDKAHASLGWLPRVGLVDGIAAQVAWHVGHPHGSVTRS